MNEAPVYSYAGFSAGSQNIMRCGTCQSLIFEDGIEGHSLWHDYLTALIQKAAEAEDKEAKGQA